MRSISIAGIAAALILFASAMPTQAKSVKYTSEDIGAQQTCKSEDEANPVKDCMQEFGEKFCKEKGHKTYVMVNWSSSGGGFSDPTIIYCK